MASGELKITYSTCCCWRITGLGSLAPLSPFFCINEHERCMLAVRFDDVCLPYSSVQAFFEVSFEC